MHGSSKSTIRKWKPFTRASRGSVDAARWETFASPSPAALGPIPYAKTLCLGAPPRRQINHIHVPLGLRAPQHAVLTVFRQ